MIRNGMLPLDIIVRVDQKLSFLFNQLIMLHRNWIKKIVFFWGGGGNYFQIIYAFDRIFDML